MRTLALASEEILFAVKETEAGTLAYPTSTDVIRAVGTANVNQADELLEDGQLSNRRSRLSKIKGRTNPGTWSFTTYTKPSGVLGTAPEHDILFECAMGKKATGSGNSIEYTFDSANVLPSFSLWRRVGHSVFAAAGCTVNQMGISVTGASISQISWSGEFMKWYRAGTSALSADADALDTEIVVVDSKLYTPKMKIKIGTLDNSGSGFTISAVNYSTNTLTISPALTDDVEIGDVVSPWLPTPSYKSGQPIHGKLGIVKIAGQDAIILESSIQVTNNIKYYVDEKNGVMYPTIYGTPTFRDVTGTLRLYFYQNIPGYFYKSEYQIQDALIIPAGDKSGSIMEISCPRIEYETPSLEGDTEVMVSLGFTAVGSATGDDEMKITFK